MIDKLPAIIYNIILPLGSLLKYIDEANRPYNDVADLVLGLEQQRGNVSS
jgi:hypothetical protein